ncbi:MAG: T9SS type A sorting domain-containing protein [Calditrichaeota bacterium]|nr:T9SS type A sorting domain-containing protein [Calditrichota bacterium]
MDLGGRAFLPALRADKNVRPPSAQVGGLLPVRLSLYALDGREVLRLHDGPLSPGTHQFRFSTSIRMPSGVYFLRLQAGTHSRTVKAVLMR